LGGKGGPESQASAAGAEKSLRRPLAVQAANVVTKPATEEAATASCGPTHSVSAPAATPMPQAVSTRHLNCFARRQPARTRALTRAPLPATAAQAVAAAPSPALMPSQARRNTPLGRSVASAGTLAGAVLVARRVRTVASRSALVSASSI